MADKEEKVTPDWAPPPSIEDTYQHLRGNKFASLNSDTAGARKDEPRLPIGKAEFQLYSCATPNGQKASVACEEFGIKYDAHFIDIMAGDQFTKDFVAMNPNSKIPAMKHGDTNIFESGAILIYLAEKYKKFMPMEGPKRAECLSWIMWQMSTQGPMTGNFGHFYRYAPRNKHEVINYGVARYGMEVRRMMSVIDLHLKDKTWFLGDEYSIADMAIYPWVMALGKTGYNAENFLNVRERYPEVYRWCARMEARPAVQRGMLVCGSAESQAKLDELRKQASLASPNSEL